MGQMSQHNRVFWLGDQRGNGADWVTQQWVITTGRRIDLPEFPWLDGPVADVYGVTGDYFEKLALIHGLAIDRGRRVTGLMSSINTLASDDFDPSRVDPAVAKFYEQTSLYQLDVWSEWSGAFRPFGALLRHLFSSRLQQLNVPISAMDTCRGMTSEILPFIDPNTQDVLYTGWLRRYIDSGNVLYAGIYSTCSSCQGNERFVKVVFPLPHGNAIVIMRPYSPCRRLAYLSIPRFEIRGTWILLHRSSI